MTRSARTRLSSTPTYVAVSEAAKIVTPVTSATPIVSAAAVCAVRDWIAHRVRPAEAAGQPEPRHRRADDPGERPGDVLREHRCAQEEQERAGADQREALREAVEVSQQADQHEPDAGPLRRERHGSARPREHPSTWTSCIAAIGGTPLAFQAGTRAEASVTTMPATRPTRIDCGLTCRLVAGRAAPTALKPTAQEGGEPDAEDDARGARRPAR